VGIFVHLFFFALFFDICLVGKNFFLYLYQQNETDMNNFQSITDNKLRKDLISAAQSMQGHHLARLAMMMAEERGIDLSYEDALKL